jgi:HAD superfamily hydrolase (TIGR01549 family)
MAIKAIIFDFVQTLGTAAEGYKTAESNSQNKLFNNLSISDWEEYKNIYRKERKEHFLRSDFSRKNVWLEICSKYNKTPDNEFLESLESEYWDVVQKSMKLFPETLSVLSALKKKYKLGMITNSQKDGSTRALDSEDYIKMEAFFDHIIISAEGDIPAKPDPVPFKMMLKKLEIKSEDALFVGDDFRVDIEGSINAGIKAVWLKHYSVKRNWPENSLQVPEIDNLEKLYDIDKLLKNT